MYEVLIVDDERYIREGLREFIAWRSEGFTIIGEAADGESALQLIRRHPPDVVLCDIRMPHLDGLALVDSVHREIDRSPAFIMLSGYDDFSYAQKALRLGVSNYLLKPVQRDELVEELRRIRRQIEADAEQGAAAGSGLDFLLRSPSPEAIARALGVSPATARGAETCIYRFVVTRYEAMQDVSLLIDQLEPWFVCNERPLTRRASSTVLDCVHVRGHSLRRHTLREFEAHVTRQCETLAVAVRVFRSPVFKGLDRTAEAFAALGDAMETAFYVDDRFTYRSPTLLEHGYNPFLVERIRDLAACVGSLSFESLDHELGEIGVTLRASPVQPESVLGAANAFCVDVWRLVAEKEGSIEDLESITGGKPQPDVALGVSGILEELRSYGRAAIGYLKSIHSDTDNQVVRDIELYVSRHLTERLRVKDIAERLGLHPYYVGRLFKEQRGVSITDYVHGVRVEHAKKLLVSRQAPLSDIAAWVGYGDSEYFSRKFKEIVGVSPRAYREKD